MFNFLLSWIIYYSLGCVRAKSLQWCLTLCDPVDCSPPGSSVHGILQARILERVAMPSCRGSSRPKAQTPISSISLLADELFTTSATWEAQGWAHILSPPCSLYPLLTPHSRDPKTTLEVHASLEGLTEMGISDYTHSCSLLQWKEAD